MKLPNLEKATIAPAKLLDYLLSDTHAHGRHKAAFFKRFGFSRDDWATLRAELFRHASIHEVSRVESSPFGMRYIIDGTLVTPDGRNPRIRAVWFVENGADIPRIVTAFPL